ncbi:MULTISPECIES: hypothetical protein [Enterobacterales]|uniref:hypothetical protein n=1 Tax=Enterobacterales TaxID=91347 RepID=UPI002ED9FC2B
MLLTMDEAQDVIDDLDNSQPVILATTYAGNIKDSIAGAKNISKLASYADAGKLVYRLKGFGIQAIQYQYGGQAYVKITGYASLRRILRGTRYKINHPQILELGIGKAGINGNILEGAKFCVWFSLAYRTIQLIFKSDHDVAVFIGNITMDVAKIIVTIFVTIFVTKVMVAVGGALVAGAASVGFAFTLPIAAGIVLVVAVGFLITLALDYLDNDTFHLFDKLISAIRDGLNSQAEVEKWNLEHTSPFTFGMLRTDW